LQATSLLKKDDTSAVDPDEDAGLFLKLHHLVRNQWKHWNDIKHRRARPWHHTANLALNNSIGNFYHTAMMAVGQSDLSIQSQSHIEPHSRERSSSAHTDSATSTEAPVD